MAAAAREASPDDTGLGGSRGLLGVTRDELLVALWLSLACAVTAALVAVPAGAAEFLVDDLSRATLGEGLHPLHTLRDSARMQRREPYTVEVVWITTTARWGAVVAITWRLTLSLFWLPVCYVAYLGASLKVCCVVLGSAVLALMVTSAGFVASGNVAFLLYSPAFGFALLVVALKLICQRESKIPRHALKNALAFMVGNVLVTNVIPEKTVGAFTYTLFEQ
jgi:hypothetical protein